MLSQLPVSVSEDASNIRGKRGSGRLSSLLFIGCPTLQIEQEINDLEGFLLFFFQV